MDLIEKVMLSKVENKIQWIEKYDVNNTKNLKNIFSEAYSSVKEKGKIEEELKHYTTLFEDRFKQSINNTYEKLVETLFNTANGPPWESMGKENDRSNRELMKSVLFGFNPYRARNLKFEELKEKIKAATDENIDKWPWKNIIKGSLDGARLLGHSCGENHNLTPFWNLIKEHDETVATRWLLAKKLEEVIDGFGTSLACDFLKELGFVNYVKPDTHLRRIFGRIGLVNEKNKEGGAKNDLTVFYLVNKIAVEVGKKPVEVDKVFWIMGSGKFERTGEGINKTCPADLEKYTQCKDRGCKILELCDKYNELKANQCP